MDAVDLLGQEWVALHNSYEQYERGGLLIKLFSVVAAGAGWVLGLNETLLIGLVLVLWLQEGIYRTFQARLGQRIERVESLIQQGVADKTQAFQLHSNWLARRKGGVALLAEYGASACRPTVAFPHVLVLLALLALVVPSF
jgi:hypothetical protein